LPRRLVTAEAVSDLSGGLSRRLVRRSLRRLVLRSRKLSAKPEAGSRTRPVGQPEALAHLVIDTNAAGRGIPFAPVIRRLLPASLGKDCRHSSSIWHRQRSCRRLDARHVLELRIPATHTASPLSGRESQHFRCVYSSWSIRRAKSAALGSVVDIAGFN